MGARVGALLRLCLHRDEVQNPSGRGPPAVTWDRRYRRQQCNANAVARLYEAGPRQSKTGLWQGRGKAVAEQHQARTRAIARPLQCKGWAVAGLWLASGSVATAPYQGRGKVVTL